MRKNVVRYGVAGLAACALMGFAAPHAQAQSWPSLNATAADQKAPPVRGKHAGDIVIGLSALGALPMSGGSVSVIGGKPEASNTVTGQLDVTYFLTDRFSLNLIAATTKHDLAARGSAIGDAKLGHVWLLPPTLTVQYHPFPRARISPYVGAGLTVGFFYGEGGTTSAAVNRVMVDTAVGPALNFGVDYELTPHWGLNFDVKKIFLRPDVSVNSGAIRAHAEIDPWLIGAGVRYRF